MADPDDPKPLGESDGRNGHTDCNDCGDRSDRDDCSDIAFLKAMTIVLGLLAFFLWLALR